MPKTDALKAFITWFEKKFSGEQTEFASGINEFSQGAIDDGRYGDPMRDERPAMVRKDDQGWQSLIR